MTVRNILYSSWLIVIFCGSLAGEEEIEFNRDIRPILSDNCYQCHGPDEHERKGDLRLDSRPDEIAPLSEELMQAVLDAQRFNSFGARRRQMLYIGGLLRKIDASRIEEMLKNQRQGRAEGAQTFHRIERWRDVLIDGDETLLAKICADYPGADHQHLNQLVRSARREREQNKDKKSARSLFRFLRDMVDAGKTS